MHRNLMRLSGLLLVASAVPIAFCPLHAADTLEELHQDERRAIDSITTSRVLSTISFLASDEMAGRDTPSKELNIACAYVAARFRGAGLRELGPDGTFFQTHRLPMEQVSTTPAVLETMTKQPLRHLGVLWGGAADFDFRGTVSSTPDSGSAGPVVIDAVTLAPQLLQQPARALATIARATRHHVAKGATALLMRVTDDSLLVDLARQNADAALLVSSGPRISVPVLLIPDDTDLASPVHLSIPALQNSSVPVRNVIGVLPGSDSAMAQDAILITAHLDHIGLTSFGPDRINNGADDNATGVTAVLALADAFSELPTNPARSVIFMTFWGEEKGLQGSKHFVQQPLWNLDRIVANINLEMVGRPETDAREKAWMTGWAHSDLGTLMNAGSGRIGVEIFNRTDVGEMLYTRSDNYSFVKAGVIAHSFSAGSLHADYHQPGDEWQKLDIPHMTRVIQGLFAGTLPIANGTVTPEKSPSKKSRR